MSIRYDQNAMEFFGGGHWSRDIRGAKHFALPLLVVEELHSEMDSGHKMG